MKIAISLTALAAGAALFLTFHAATEAQTESAKMKHVAANAVMTPEQVERDLALAEEAFSRVHPGYTRYASADEMKASWANILAEAQSKGGLPLGDFYLAVNRALTQIRCDHTKADLPISIRDARKGQPLYLPMRWEWIEGRGVIDVAAPSFDAERGDEIIAVDGRPLSEIVEDIKPYIPVDGYTEWSRSGEVGQSLEFMGGGVDHFGALLWDVPEQAEITLRGPDGETRTITTPRISFTEWSDLGRASAANFKDAVSFQKLDESVGYLRVDTFVNYRDPVKPKEIYQPIFKAMREDGLTTLILDLRRNGGGSSDAQYELLANLLEAPHRPIKEMRVKTIDLDGIRPYLWTWDSRALDPNPLGFSKNEDGTYALRRFVSSDLKTVKPAKYRFTGKIIVLTGPMNSSASTNTAALLKDLGRAVLVGERTGGSAEGATAGLQFTLTLPESGVRMRLPFFFMINNVSGFERGLGVSPDIDAPMTLDAFRAGRDPALEMAKSIARSPVKAVLDRT
ncbi:MAG: S41 family peptidase [Pseudomonadota bacterium]